jgi:hypothetical protein
VSCNGFSSFVLFVLIVFLMFFFLIFVSFGFIVLLATMTLRPRLVVFVDNISEGSRDIAFEGKVLSQ